MGREGRGIDYVGTELGRLLSGHEILMCDHQLIPLLKTREVNESIAIH
jgi:hypothetical protein